MVTKRVITSGREVRPGPDRNRLIALGLKELKEFLREWMEDSSKETGLRRPLRWEEEVNDV